MNRRAFLAACGSFAGAMAGCLDDAGGANGDTTPSRTAGPTETARDADLPAECPLSPDVEGVPERPAELDRESAAEFLAEYEYALAPARGPAHASLNYIDHVRTEQVGGGYRVHFFVEPIDESSTPGSTPTTPTPTISGTYSVAYFIDEYRIKRQTRLGPTSYTGLRPERNGTFVAC